VLIETAPLVMHNPEGRCSLFLMYTEHAPDRENPAHE
jgi:hypothetical protein